MSDLPAGITAHDTQTSRLRMRWYESGSPDGIPVVLLHGNLSTGRFYDQVMIAPDMFRFLAPDMRGFGRTERVAIDATRGLRDWADDTRALLDAIGIDRPVHLAGWSTGGAAIAAFAKDRPVSSLTFIDPVSPYGFGGVKLDGTPCFPDWSGSGGGTGNPEFTSRIASGDRGEDSPFSPRNVIKSSYWSPEFEVDPAWLDVLVDEVLLSETGDDGYPGDFTSSENWPGVAPGTRGILNALSGKYCAWADIVDIDPKPPILWTHGTADIVVADNSAWEMGTLGAAEIVPGWPGADVYPPQQMVTQLRNVFAQYSDNGGRVQTLILEGSGHGCFIDAPEIWAETFMSFLASAEG